MVIELYSGSIVLPSADEASNHTSQFVATVKLVDREGNVLAATAIQSTSSPIAFELTVDPDLRDGSKTSIWAYVRSASGAWGTYDLVPTGSGHEAIEVPVTRLDS